MTRIYLVVWGIKIPKNYISVTEAYFSGIYYPNSTLHVFVCDSENYMSKIVLELFSCEIAFQLHKRMFWELIS